MMKSILLCLVAFAPFFSSAFMGQELPRTFVSQSSLAIGPFGKMANKGAYDKTVTGLMQQKGYTREKAEKEYNSYLSNPTNYALEKGEAYYKSLGYKTMMDGVLGEAEKEGKGEEVRARVEKFQKESKIKGFATIIFFFTIFAYANAVLPPVVLNN